MDDLTKISRPRGRPSKSAQASSLPVFDKITLDQCLGLSDAEVADAFDALQHEPRPLLWSADDPAFNYSLYNSDHPDEPNVKPTKDELAQLHEKAKASFAVSTRVELYSTMLMDWVKSIAHSDLLKMLKVRGVECSETKIRYTSLASFQGQLVAFLYHEAVQGSEKYPKNHSAEPQLNKGGRKQRSTMK